VADVKKPSEIAQSVAPDARDTSRPTDMKDLETQAQKARNSSSTTVCCCVDPYFNEEPSEYAAPTHSREGDVFKHRVHFRTRVVCFNLCYNTESTTQTVIQRASDGSVLKTVTVDELNQPAQFFLVRSEKCKHKHHELRRFTFCGRILYFLCTVPGVTSTCKKCVCIEDCVSTENVETIRCERSLYSRRHF
jgi:hypothetical protein